MADSKPDPADEQLDPAAERVRRKLVRFMAINLGILFLALMAVVAALVYRAFLSSGPDETPAMITEIPTPPPGSMLTGEIALPDGARVVSHALSGNRLTIDIEVSGERSILVYDIAEGRIIGRFTLSGAR
ncbi:fimbrial protein [Chelativorans sp. ZYF759]|uniref:fimbrial protein n=1 Tax=Chelativorans sp. ZYF759 TaxID=2692213 RepID=UPI00145C9DD0|nr:fimbrial protein [Chelativorans sp. ZYF759]NMG38213.1 fimbrial protein [Chelativorans sp. ZYF759]